MLVFEFVFADSLARIDVHSLSHQSRCELIVAGMDGRMAFYHPDTDDFLDISEWAGLTFDGNDNITKISWDSFGNYKHGDYTDRITIPKGGRLDLQWLLETLISCEIAFLDLTGTVQTSHLPRGLTMLDLASNNLSGTFDVTGLPPTIEIITIPSNRFQGSLDLTCLPPTVTRLKANANYFDGSLDLTKLPESLSELCLIENCFQGTINLESLPQSLRVLLLRGNNISQKELRVGHPKAHFRLFSVDWHSIGTIVDSDGASMKRSWHP